MDLCTVRIQDQPRVHRETEISRGFETVHFGRPSVRSVAIPDTERSYEGQRLDLHIRILAGAGAVEAAHATAAYYRRVALTDLEQLVAQSPSSVVIAFRSQEEASIRTFPRRGHGMGFGEIVVDEAYVPNTELVLRPLLLALVAARVLEGLRDRTEYAWKLLVLRRATERLGPSFLGVLGRCRLTGAYLLLHRSLGMIADDPVGFSERLTAVWDSLHRDMSNAVAILGAKGIHDLAVPPPADRQTARSALLSARDRRAQRGALVLAAAAVLVAVLALAHR